MKIFLLQNCIAIKMNCYVYCQLQLPWQILDMYKPIDGISSLSYSCNIGMSCVLFYIQNWYVQASDTGRQQVNGELFCFYSQRVQINYMFSTFFLTTLFGFIIWQNDDVYVVKLNVHICL
jgi:hypothetical protein